MVENRWKRVEDLFHRAVDLPPAERARFLDAACAADRELREEVQSLLAADVDGGPVLEAAIADAAVRLRARPEEDGTLPAGKRIGPYSIGALIGRGGMGAVYRAVRDGEFRMEVALKLLKRGTDTESALGHFRRERQILAALAHPNIARLLDGGATEDGLPYFAMEYVDGRPLLDAAASLSIRQRLELFRSVCAAVQYAHQNLVVHRDLKPGNILVTKEGTPKLLDFGIAKLLDPASTDGGPTPTIAGARLMTPDYASPEQVRGEPVTTATDVYSLGVILYELLTGERPYRISTRSRQEIDRAIGREEPKRPSAANGQLDDDLDNIVLTALRKEPQRRYPSVEQLSDDVRRYLEGRPIRARKDTFVYRATKFVRRNRLGVIAAALAGIGVAAGVVAVNRQARRAEYRFQQVRKLAHSVLFDLNPQIESLAGSTKAQEQLVKTSLAYLDSLASEGGNDPSLLLELAQAYEKVGDVQGNPKVRNLGQEEAALASYGKAIALVENLDRSEPALELVARTYSKIGAIQGWVSGHFNEARSSLRRAVEVADSIPARTGVPAYRIRVYVYGTQGDLEADLHPDQAIEPYRRSLEIARQCVAAAPSRESRDLLSRAIARRGNLLRTTGDLTAARESLLEALRMTDELRDEEPGNVVWNYRRANLGRLIGLVAGYPRSPNLGDLEEAEARLRETVEETESFATDRYDQGALSGRSLATGMLAAVVGESDPARAEPLFRRALALGDSVLKMNPGDVEERALQAERRIDFARILDKLGKRAEALSELQTAVEMVGDSPGRRTVDFLTLETSAAALLELAACRLEMRDDRGAERDLERALRLLEPLRRQYPRQLLVLRDLADCHQGFGDLAASRGDWKRARAEYQSSLDLWETWKQIGVSSVYDQRRRDAVSALVSRASTRGPKNSPPR